MVGTSVAETRGTLPLSTWDKPVDVSTMDSYQFRTLHRRLFQHRQNVTNCQGTMNTAKFEDEMADLQVRAEGMRQGRLRHKLEAARELKSENARLVERLCSVVRESENRQRGLMSGVRTRAGMLNASFRRKIAHQVDKDNKMMLDRLKQAGPGIENRTQLAAKYKVHQALVIRHCRFKRGRGDVDMTIPPAPPKVAQKRPTPAWRKANLPLVADASDESEGEGSSPATPSMSSSAPQPAAPKVPAPPTAPRTAPAKIGDAALPHWAAGAKAKANAKRQAARSKSPDMEQLATGAGQEDTSAALPYWAAGNQNKIGAKGRAAAKRNAAATTAARAMTPDNDAINEATVVKPPSKPKAKAKPKPKSAARSEAPDKATAAGGDKAIAGGAEADAKHSAGDAEVDAEDDYSDFASQQESKTLPESFSVAESAHSAQPSEWDTHTTHSNPSVDQTTAHVAETAVLDAALPAVNSGRGEMAETAESPEQAELATPLTVESPDVTVPSKPVSNAQVFESAGESPEPPCATSAGNAPADTPIADVAASPEAETDHRPSSGLLREVRAKAASEDVAASLEAETDNRPSSGLLREVRAQAASEVSDVCSQVLERIGSRERLQLAAEVDATESPPAVAGDLRATAPAVPESSAVADSDGPRPLSAKNLQTLEAENPAIGLLDPFANFSAGIDDFINQEQAQAREQLAESEGSEKAALAAEASVTEGAGGSYSTFEEQQPAQPTQPSQEQMSAADHSEVKSSGNEANPPEEEEEVVEFEMQRAAGQKFGMVVQSNDEGRSAVASIRAGGRAEEWGSQNPNMKISVGDILISVNGETDHEKIMTEFRSSSAVTIRMVKQIQGPREQAHEAAAPAAEMAAAPATAPALAAGPSVDEGGGDTEYSEFPSSGNDEEGAEQVVEPLAAGSSQSLMDGGSGGDRAYDDYDEAVPQFEYDDEEPAAAGYDEASPMMGGGGNMNSYSTLGGSDELEAVPVGVHGNADEAFSIDDDEDDYSDQDFEGTGQSLEAKLDGAEDHRREDRPDDGYDDYADADFDDFEDDDDEEIVVVKGSKDTRHGYDEGYDEEYSDDEDSPRSPMPGSSRATTASAKAQATAGAKQSKSKSPNLPVPPAKAIDLDSGGSEYEADDNTFEDDSEVED